MSDPAAEVVTWALAALLAAAAAGVPLAALMRWRRHPVASVFLVLAGLALGPWALHELELAYRMSLDRRVAAAVLRDAGLPPDADPRGELFNRLQAEQSRRVRADPVGAFAARNPVARAVTGDDARTLSWSAATALALAAAGCRSRRGPGGPPAVE